MIARKSPFIMDTIILRRTICACMVARSAFLGSKIQEKTTSNNISARGGQKRKAIDHNPARKPGHNSVKTSAETFENTKGRQASARTFEERASGDAPRKRALNAKSMRKLGLRTNGRGNVGKGPLSNSSGSRKRRGKVRNDLESMEGSFELYCIGNGPQ
jgi:hypothetical protein